MNRKSQNTFKPKKYLGQNFLISPSLAKKMISSCNLQPSETVVEIGPGHGILTQGIAPQVQQVIAIEKDSFLAQNLKKSINEKNLEIVNADFLKFDIRRLGIKVKIVGNLPYYISTPILLKLIENRSCIKSAFITVQFEFGQRLVAQPGSKIYGSLSCLTQYYATAKNLFKIKNTAFYPQPKVQSCFIQLDFRDEPLLKVKSESFLFQVIRLAFQQRRKTLKNALASVAKIDSQSHVFFEKTKIDLGLRAENLSLEDFAKLADYFFEQQIG